MHDFESRREIARIERELALRRYRQRHGLATPLPGRGLLNALARIACRAARRPARTAVPCLLQTPENVEERG